MTNILLMLLLPVIRVVSPVPSCPASCAVCSKDAIICQRLANIIDAPDSTQALLLTEGSISTIQPASLSDLSNITIISLSNNRISELSEEAFRNLPFLHTLLLDHNLLTSTALQGGALTNLTQLEVLSLGHNTLSMIEPGWFEGTKALRSLKLEGNRLTSLDSESFPLMDLRNLESLDLSENLIDQLDINSFRGLVSLKALDLSRNRLSSAPAEAFSYLNWLTNLNLDLNSWNCSCQLLELATFLSTFIQHPDKTLYNGRRMVCVSADNPAVTTVLELTEANCVPSNQNITVQIDSRDSVTPQQYARDVAITAVICFIGGKGLTLLVVLIYYQVRRKKKLKESQRLKEEGEGSSTMANHINHLDVGELRKDIFFQGNGNPPWNKDGPTLDTRTDINGGQFLSRTEENGGIFLCPNCSSDGPRLNPTRRDNRMNGGLEIEEMRDRGRMRMMMIEQERRRTGLQKGALNSDTPNKFPFQSNTNSSSHSYRDGLNQKTATMPRNKTARNMESQRIDEENTGHEALHCEGCQRAYRPPDQRQERFYSNQRGAAPFDGPSSQHRLNERGRNGNYHFDMMKNSDSRRETRNVTFDLENPRTPEKRSGEKQVKVAAAAAASGDKDKTSERRHKVPPSRRVMVKLNLNPLRKSKVHPGKKSEQGHSQKSPRKSREKPRSEKDEKRKKTKKSSDRNKSHKAERLTEDGEKEEGGEEGQTGKASSKQRKAASKGEEGGQDGTEGNRGAEIAQPAYLPANGQSIHGVQYQGPGFNLGGVQRSSQLPFSFLPGDRNPTTNPSLLGLAGPQLAGSSASLQGGNFMLNTMASPLNLLPTGGPAPSLGPALALSGPSLALSGAPDSLNRQAAAGLTYSAPSLIANPVLANTLQASVGQTTLLHGSQTGGRNLAANTTVNPTSLSQNQLTTDNAPLVAKLNPDPVQGSGPNPGEGLNQVSGDSKATKEGMSVQDQDITTEMTPQNTDQVNAVVNISTSNSQIETGVVAAGSTGDMSVGGVALTGRPAVGGSGDSMQAPGVSGLGFSAADLQSQSESSSGSALLQQEYLAEDGNSSPRRKLRLVIPEKTSSRPPTALERKIR